MFNCIQDVSFPVSHVRKGKKSERHFKHLKMTALFVKNLFVEEVRINFRMRAPEQISNST